MVKLNCWEYKKCGRQPGGANALQLGVCPAAMETRTHGVNGGAKGGRACWPIAGTLCGGKVQGSFAAKMQNCMQCDFYKIVQQEEGKEFVFSSQILNLLKDTG